MGDRLWEPYLKKVEFARKLLKERSLDYFQGSLVGAIQPRAPHWNFRRNIEMARQVDVAVDRFLQQTLDKQIDEPVLIYPKLIRKPSQKPRNVSAAAVEVYSATHQRLPELSPKRRIRRLANASNRQTLESSILRANRSQRAGLSQMDSASELYSTSGGTPARSSSTKRSFNRLLRR